MKKVDTSNIIEFVRKLGATGVTLTHIIAAIQETTDAIVRGITENAGGAIVLYGCVNSGAGSNYIISAGAIWYNGEIYLVDAFTGTTGGGQTIVLSIVTTYDSGDPVKYSNNQSYYTHSIRKIQFNVGTSGSGIINFSAVTYLSNMVSTGVTAAIATSLATAEAYADSLVVGLWDDRGSFSAAGGNYPSTGGSGPAGAIKKGDIWTISVAGTLPTGQIVEIGDTVRALVDTPGNTQANWGILQNNIGYVPVNKAGDSMSGALAMGSNKITGLGAATGNGDALRYEQLIGLYLLLSGGTMTGVIDMNSHKITGLSAGSNPSDAVRFDQLTTLTTIVNIGDWNMDTTVNVDVAHGLSDGKKIVSVQAVIRNDGDNLYEKLEVADLAGTTYVMDGWIDFTYASGFPTVIRLYRRTGGRFDNVGHSTTSFNRGFLIIQSTP